VKTVAFVFGLFIITFGIVGVAVPSITIRASRLFATSGSFYALAAIRIVFGLILIRAASTSRMPRAIRVLGYVVVILGIAAGVTGLLAVEWARGITESWSQQGSIIVRLTCVALIALGSFVAYACAPIRRSAK